MHGFAHKLRTLVYVEMQKKVADSYMARAYYVLQAYTTNIIMCHTLLLLVKI